MTFARDSASVTSSHPDHRHHCTLPGSPASAPTPSGSQISMGPPSFSRCSHVSRTSSVFVDVDSTAPGASITRGAITFCVLPTRLGATSIVGVSNVVYTFTPWQRPS